MKNLSLLLIISFLLPWQIFACTTVVISGKYTKDGRPIIWKLRDTDFHKNDVRYYTDGHYDYVGLINSVDEKGEQVWAGVNSAGFAIMNSASFNVNENDETLNRDKEGYVMKQALMLCANIRDFETYLDTLSRPMGLSSHFGVLDAEGNAVFYEVNNRAYTKYDANDPETAPDGYVLRTNYSYTGTKDKGYGYIRYETANTLLQEAKPQGYDVQSICQEFSRSMKHSLLKKDFREEYQNKPKNDDFINSGDLITRHGSASAVVIQGIKDKEPAYLSNMWTMVGFPSTSMVIPVFPFGNTLPKVLMKDASGKAPLSRFSLQLKDKVYPIKRSSGYKYMKVSELVNAEHNGIMDKIEKAEAVIFRKTEENLEKWRKMKNPDKELQSFYEWIDSYVLSFYQKEFGLE